ncbi:MAG: toll/interleukin-1 receptor domain-containing protein [Bryobacterales bacterium]|nr:toll/interleukin-1 receptor domain-containing protein [Bryobacterales bacterium]
MKSIFVSYSFRDQDRELVTEVEQLLASHGIRAVTGRRLGGQALPAEIERRIQASDGLIALMTRRDQLGDGSWITHPWVQDEATMGRTKGRPVIALVEDGVKPPGQNANFEWLPLDRADRVPALLALSETIGLWKRESGRVVKVQILPDELARDLGQSNGVLKCRYRLFEQDQASEWVEVTPIPEPGGTFVYVNRVRDDHSIQLAVQGGVKQWISPARSQWMEMRLQEAQGGV